MRSALPVGVILFFGQLSIYGQARTAPETVQTQEPGYGPGHVTCAIHSGSLGAGQ